MRLLRLLSVTLTLLPVALLWPTLEGLVASGAWVALIAFSRLPNRSQTRAERLSVDRLIAVICLVGFFLGGLYWVPAAATFWMIDRLDTTSDLAIRNESILGRALPPGVSLGVLAAVSGLAGIAAFLFLPIYSVARSSAVPIGGTPTNSVSAATGLDVGLTPGAAGVLTLAAVLFVMVALGSISNSRGHPAGRVVLGLAGVGVVLIGAIGVLTIGAFILPGIVLTLLTLAIVFRPRPTADFPP